MTLVSKTADPFFRRISDGTRSLRHPEGPGRLALFGLAVVLVALPAFALWGAISTYRSGTAAKDATHLSAVFEEARYAVGSEESLERKYRLEPSPEVHALHHAAAAALVGALERARTLSKSSDIVLIGSVLAKHVQYLAAIDHMFAAIDAGDTARANEIDGGEVDPTFDDIETRVLAAADERRANAMQHLNTLTDLQTRVVIATPIVFALGLGLVIFFWTVLRSYQAQAKAATAHEAAAMRQSEQRFRLLIQNASDIVLICAPAGLITYQSPAAETAWGYGGTDLMDRRLISLVHVNDQPAAHDLWQQVQEAPGTSRNTELRLRDGAGAWRYVEFILTNLLHEPAIQGVVVTAHDINERKAFEQQLAQQAFHDSLTGLPNRALFRDRLDQALARAGRRQSSVGLLFVDLDNFKLVNDSLGHPIGDKLLVEAAKRLQACVQVEHTVARLGGDEFVFLLEHLGSEADIRPVAEKIISQFAKPFTIDGRDLVVTASIGIALGSGASHENPDSLLRNADVAMYRAKSAGKGRHVTFDTSMQNDTLARLELEGDLRRALENGELRVFYQPIVLMETGRIAEVEALVRWQHPIRGLVAPIDFIPIAEETGLIVPLGQWVLEEACRQTMAWHVEFPVDPPLIVGVNLSPRQFQTPNLLEEVGRALRETGLPPHCLKLEITEGVIMQDVEATIATLGQLKGLGIQLAIDDFGTGYSSLAYLKRLPLDVLKIDRSFVKGIGQNREDTAIVRAIISLAKSLGLTITGEGIESAEQAALLGAWACDRGQGYLFGKPVARDEATVLLQSTNLNISRSKAA